MGLVSFRQNSTLFCCCHLVLHILCCIVENKPLSLSLSQPNRITLRIVLLSARPYSNVESHVVRLLGLITFPRKVLTQFSLRIIAMESTR